MIITSTKALVFRFTCILCLGVLCNMNVFGQRADSVNYITRSRKAKPAVIKPNLPVYRPLGFIPFNSVIFSKTPVAAKPEKNLTFLKVFPSPVDDQISIVYKLERESTVSIKIMDLLGNEVVSLANERSAAGEQTKTYTIPNRLSSGIYFVRIVAGAETSVKRISVL